MKNLEKITHSLSLCVGLAFLIIIFSQNLWKKPENKNNHNTPQILGAQINARGALLPTKQINLKPLNESQLKDVQAKSFMVFDLKTGQVYAQSNQNLRLPIASLTKLMTGYVVLQNLNWNTTAQIWPKNGWEVLPSLHLNAGETVSVGDLFNSMLVGSANDAAFALAQIYTSSTKKDFVAEMNLEAENLKMGDTTFSNPVGLDSGSNFSTAADLKILITEVLKIGAFRNLAKTSSYSFLSEDQQAHKVTATNKLIERFSDLGAIKTGYTKTALGSMATLLDYEGAEVVILVLDSQNREADTLLLRKTFLESQ